MKTHTHLRACRTVLLSLLLLLFSCAICSAQKQLGEATLVHFETASAELSGKQIAKLEKLAAAIKGQAIERILVEGYCDRRRIVNDYAYDTNQQLSQARAYNVSIFLQNRTGLPANLFSRFGYGASKMVAANDSPAGLAVNRRVEVRVFLAD